MEVVPLLRRSSDQSLIHFGVGIDIRRGCPNQGFALTMNDGAEAALTRMFAARIE